VCVSLSLSVWVSLSQCVCPSLSVCESVSQCVGVSLSLYVYVSKYAMDYIGDRWETAPVKETVADWALFGVPSAEASLMAGFTTVRDVGSWRDMPDVALMRAIDRGVVPGPRIIASGHMLSITGGHCDITGFAPGIMPEHPYYGVADGVDEVVKAVRYQIKHGAKVIKICATAGVYSFEDTVGAQQFTEEEMQAAVEEAARHGLKVAAHAHGAEGMYAAVKAGGSLH